MVKHDNTSVGKCKWYSYTRQNGDLIKCQGTWELKFAKWADSQSLSFITHQGRITYVNENGQNRSYYPDFYIEGWKCYVDVKSEYYQKLNKNKMLCVFRSNPTIVIKILGRKELNDLGIKV